MADKTGARRPAGGEGDGLPLFLCSLRGSESGRHLILTLAAGSPDGEKNRRTVTEAVYAAIGSPLRGDRLTEEQTEAILAEDERFRALRQGYRLLACADNSERALLRKLRAKGFSEEAAAAAVREAVEDGALCEERQLDRLILGEVGRGLSGPRKLLRKLAARGYRPADIRARVGALAARGEIDFEKSKRALIEKFAPRLAASCATDEEYGEKMEIILYKYG